MENVKGTEVADLCHTLNDKVLREQFRFYINTKIHESKTGYPNYKKMIVQWLDFIVICENLLQVPAANIQTATKLMVQIGSKYLGKHPKGYNMALKNQENRKELTRHCEELLENPRL